MTSVNCNMIIPHEFAQRFVYHFTHIKNLPDLLNYGFLAKNHTGFPLLSKSIAAPSIQERRSTMAVPCGAGGVVHDYVPFYFGSLSPMLLGVINSKNIDQSDILYFEFPITILNRPGAVFTSASANTNPPPTFYDDVTKLESLNWTEIDSLKWSSETEELRHERMAEVLLPWHVSVADAKRVVVWNASARERVQKIVADLGKPFPEIGFEVSNRRHWFKKFNPPEDKGFSLVTGPVEIAALYRDAVELVCSVERPVLDAKYQNPAKLLDAIRQNFGCIAHTSELVGLRSANGIHKLTVDKHTCEVVDRLKNLPEFKAFDAAEQGRLELAAYLHDIGKGPKSRWEWSGGLQKVDADHPVRALAMMVEIFSQDVAQIKPETAKILFKLVCYHDLVGEVIGKGRDESQIVDVADNEAELRMLFAIGKADATSLSEMWWNEEQALDLYTRCLKKIKSKGL